MRMSPRTGLPIVPKGPPRPSERCADPAPEALLQGITQFNAGDFWDCHETLEALWRGEADPIRSLYQGILLVGIGYYHLQRGNRTGALAKLNDGLQHLAPFRPACMGVDVECLLVMTQATVHAVSSSAASVDTPDSAMTSPQIVLIPKINGRR